MSFVTKVWRPPAMTLTESISDTGDTYDDEYSDEYAAALSASEPRTFDESHVVQANELGKFGFTTFEVDALDIQLGDLVSFYADGVCIGGGTLRTKRTTKVSPRTEAVAVIDWVGVRPIGVFEYGAIRPARGLGSIATDRVWGWMGVSFDDSAWGTATEIAAIDDTTTHHWQYVLGDEYYASLDIEDSPFRDISAFWVWDSTGSDEFALEGDCYGRQSFTVPAGVTEIELEAVADARADFYIEGQRELSTEFIYGDPKPGDVKRVRVSVDAGPKVLAVYAENNPDYDFDGDHNPAGVAWAVWSLDPATGEHDTVLCHSDSTVTWLGYPVTPPGVTPGEVLLELLTEFQGAGYFEWITPTFTADLDSAGDAWPEVGEIGTKVGYSVWKLIQQLTTVYIDTDVDPDTTVGLEQEWNVWAKGNRGTDTAVEFAPTDDPDTSNVTEHVITEVLQRGNQMLHYSRFGWWLESEVFTGLKIDATLGLGALESFRAVQRYAQAQLDQTSSNLVEHDIAILPTGTGDVPMVDFNIGDRVTIAGGLEEVVELGWRRDRNGVIWWDTDENRGKKQAK